MPQRNVAGLARNNAHRDADQIRPHGVKRGRFGVDGNNALGMSSRYPALQIGDLLHQLVADIAYRIGRADRAFRRCRARGRRGGSVRQLGFKPDDQPLEFHLLQEGQHGRNVRILNRQPLERLGDSDIVLQPDEIPRDPRLIRELDQVLPALGLLDLLRPRQQRVEIAIFIDQLRRRLDANARNAWHIVDRITGQRLHVDDPFRPDAEFLDHLGPPDRPVLHRIEHVDTVVDQLHQILVGRDDGDPHALFLRLQGIGRDQVVRLIAFHFQAGHIEGPDGIADQRKLRAQILRRLVPVGFVCGIDIVPEGQPLCIEDHRHMIRLKILDQLHQHVGEAEHRVGRRAVGSVHWRQGMKRAENITGAVHQIEMVFCVGNGTGDIGRGYVGHQGIQGRASGSGCGESLATAVPMTSELAERCWSTAPRNRSIPQKPRKRHRGSRLRQSGGALARHRRAIDELTRTIGAGHLALVADGEENLRVAERALAAVTGNTLLRNSDHFERFCHLTGPSPHRYLY